jgi:spore germination protein KC
MRIKSIIISAVAVFLLLPLSGCSSIFPERTEISDLEFIRALGVDIKPDEENLVRLTIIYKSLSASGGGAQEGSQPQESVIIKGADGKTVAEAVTRLNDISEKQLFWEHTPYCIIGEEIARQDIVKYIDYLDQEPPVQDKFLCIYSQGDYCR